MMIASHLFALIPLLVLLILSLIFYGKGLVHLLSGSYGMTLGWFAVVNNWEIMFFPLIIFSVMISIILFLFSMTRGNWL